MRFDVRTPVKIFALTVIATVASLYGSGRSWAQGKAAPAAATPPTAAGSATGTAPGAAPAAAAPEGAVKDLLDKAVTILKSGKFQDALAAFNAADDAAKQEGGQDGLKHHFMAVVGRARALTGLKEYEAAMNEISSVLIDDRDNVGAHVARGLLKLEADKADEALDDFQLAVKNDPSNVEAQFGFGKALLLNGRAQEAITPLTHAIAGDPNNGEAFRLLGLVYSSLYKVKQAIESFQQAIKINPKDYEAYFALGIVYLRLEAYQDAVNQFGKAIENYSPKPGQEDVPFIQGYLTRSSTFIELGKATKDPAAQKAAYQAAFDEAQKVVSQLDQKNPSQRLYLAAALSSRGVAERMLDQFGPAIRTFTQAIDLRTTPEADETTTRFLADAYFRRGICFHLIGEDKMAISDFESAAHLVSDDPRANLWEGFTYARMGDYHQALRAYGDAIAASDRFTYAYYNRALTYMMMGEYKKAVADFNSAIRLEPANAEYYFKRGVAYQQLGEDKKASESFSAALQFNDKHVGALRHLADSMQKLGHPELATQYRQKADQLAPPKPAK